MKNLQYDQLKMQSYFLDKSLSISQKRTIFRFRTHSENFLMNYKSSVEDLTCPLCHLHPDSQIESLSCSKVRREGFSVDRYMKLFEEDIPRDTVDMIMSIMKTREAYA